VSSCFAILPDESAEGAPPLALFENLEDALEWGARRYRGGTFRVRYVAVDEIPIPPLPEAD
jgi:hypothetical protein